MPPLKKNEKVMLILIGISLVVFVVMDPYYILWKSPPGEATEETESTSGNASPQELVFSEKESLPEGRQEMDRWGRDPFVESFRYSDVDAILAGLKLGAISIRGDDRMVMINSTPLRVGDEIQGIIVSRIESDRVIMTVNGREYTLTWEE